MSVHVLGIRHHGPGGARSVERALEALQPDVVLIEGPPEADGLVGDVVAPDLVPPVALLVYAHGAPGRASFYPLAEWSPEYRALRWAAANDKPAQFIDAPAAWQLHPDSTLVRTAPPIPVLDLLAQAAGQRGEAWWEDQVELRRDDTALFEAILEAVEAVRLETGGLAPEDRYEAVREAHMRKRIRSAKRAHDCVAVVCGAFHGPALTSAALKQFKVGADNALLKGMKRQKVVATWVPWAASRLSAWSGYGAGMDAPGWYQAIWQAGLQDHAPLSALWLTRTARLLRDQGVDVSSAHVIESVRLADTLAAIRGRPRAGLTELREATCTVMLQGQAAQLDLIRQHLEVGEALGQVPDSVPTVPLQRDLDARMRAALLKPQTLPHDKVLDLRKPKHRLASVLLHQLRVLDIAWGEPTDTSGKGTFKEGWRLAWDPGFVVRVVQASSLGSSVPGAAQAQLHVRVTETQSLPELAALLDQAVLAELDPSGLIDVLDSRAAVATDVLQLLNALPPLLELRRYGTVRQTPTETLAPVIERLFERVVLGLPGACTQVDDDHAESWVEGLDQVHGAVGLLRPELRQDWTELLERLANAEPVHPLLRGRAARKLLDHGQLDDLERLARLNLNAVVPPQDAALWLDGLVRGSGVVLLHQDGLWRVLDGWMGALAQDAFHELLPMLRRAFSGFGAGERRRMGQMLRGMDGGAPVAVVELDTQRADQVLPLLTRLLGGAA